MVSVKWEPGWLKNTKIKTVNTNQKKSKKPKKKLKKQTEFKNDIARFIAIGAQIAGTLAIGVIAGHWLDRFLENDKPVMTLIFGLLFSIVALYQFYKQMYR